MLANTFKKESQSMAKALEWNNKTGHIGVERYIKLADSNTSVLIFNKSTLYNLKCIPCIPEKENKAPIVRSISFQPTQ